MSKKQKQSTKGLRPPKKHFTKQHAKVYWPYLPLILLLIGGLFLNIWQPLQKNNSATLAYATEISRSALLSSTNSQRASHGAGALSINSQLNSAAQAKANDMVARDYWAHNTPDGKEPWVFIDAQGYNYTKAGENLAYGYSTSNETIIGWMNSSSHRANMLDTEFTEVGFGFINSPDYVGTYDPDATPPVLTRAGSVTIIVGMYGKPVVNTPPPVAASQQSLPSNTSKTVPVDKPEPEIEPEAEEEPIPLSVDRFNQPFNTENDTSDTKVSVTTTKIQQLTSGNAPWSAIVVSIVGIGLSVVWLFKHFWLVRKYIIEGEHFVAHHPVLDLIVVSVIAMAVYLNQTAGVVL
jgi:hypothetical protein